MIKYTLGFIFNETRNKILLLKMDKPGRWNDGQINGIGGKLDLKELPYECMVRECLEETGMLINHWQYAGVYDGSDNPPNNDESKNEFKVFTYFTVIKEAYFKNDFKSLEGELKWYDISEIMSLKTVANLKWMVPFCLDIINENIFTTFDIKYCNQNVNK